jgi:hypothetical protein
VLTEKYQPPWYPFRGIRRLTLRTGVGLSDL